MKNRIPILGIIMCILYFCSVLGFLVFKTEFALTVWEVLTIVGAPIILLVLYNLSFLMEVNRKYRELMLVFMGGTTTLTGVAHFVNMAVTRRLLAEGIKIPTYFQIGYWPSVEMAIDYLAWGLFMGISFFVIGLGITRDERQKNRIKNILFVCGTLCIAGLLGTCIINENCWYLAPIGYGIGTIIICIEMIRYRKV